MLTERSDLRISAKVSSDERENACTVAETDENAAGNNREICHCY